MASLIREYDGNNDGVLDFNEFCSLMSERMQATDQEEKYMQGFKFIDRNGNGLISPAELKQVLKLIGENPTDEEISAMIRIADTDDDGQIDYEDFVRMISR